MVLWTLLFACTGSNIQPSELYDDTAATDADEDGFPASEDCNDADPDVFPGAAELCDGEDQDCDDSIDESPSDGTAWYPDTDLDGYGDPSSLRYFCDEPSGYADNGEDCNDGDPDINPAAQEVCDDAQVDEDCDGLSDDGDDSTDPATMITTYADSDGDGYGDPDVSMDRCLATASWIEDNTDCDDTNELATPDNECDVGWAGVYTGTFEITVDGFAGPETCTGAGEITVNPSTTPPVTGVFTCDWSGIGGTGITVTQDGEATGEDTVSGEITVGELKSVEWDGAFSGEGDLSSSTTGTGELYGSEVEYSLSISYSR